MIDVYVLNKNNKPLMPCTSSKARKLLKTKKAIVVKKTPFTIKLLYGSSGYTQPTELRVDTGSKNIGLSVVTENKEIYSGEVILRTDIVDLLSTRREFRRTRRNRKTRYRKSKFKNRCKTKQPGWLPPSVINKIDTHFNAIKRLTSIMPISKFVLEMGEFDTQLLKAQMKDLEKPSGTDYQEGEMKDFFNVRQYVLFRDKYICQCCKGKSKDKILEVHHIESRKTGGNSPSNLITLCKTCHEDYHKGKLDVVFKKQANSLKDATSMNIIKKYLYKRLKTFFTQEIEITYGYKTKNKRIELVLPKLHRVDALCLRDNIPKEKAEVYYLQKKVRCHNRQIHKATIQKGGKRKLNQKPCEVKGYRLFDKVDCKGIEGFIWGRRESGYFMVKDLLGNTISNGISYKKLELKERRQPILIQMVKNDY